MTFNSFFRNAAAEIDFAIVPIDASTVIGLPTSIDLQIVNSKLELSLESTKNICTTTKSEEAVRTPEIYSETNHLSQGDISLFPISQGL